jgi:chromate transporter
MVAAIPANAVAKLLITFGGMSLMLFGGGYVFIPLIQQMVVEGYAWVTQKEFVDAIAMGQITPGPILISATFIGYKVAGIAGAIAATVGIFSPSVVLMVMGTKAMSRLKSSAVFQRALLGIRPAVIGLIAAAAFVVARTAPVNWISLVIFLISLLVLIRFKVPVAMVIVASGMTGWAIY